MVAEESLDSVADSAEQYRALRRLAGLLVEERSWSGRTGGRKGKKGTTGEGDEAIAEREGFQAAEEERGERSTPRERWSLVPWLRTPEWMASSLALPHERGGADGTQEEEQQGRAAGTAREVEGVSSRGHAVVVMGPMAYCAKCGNFARRRVGAGLKGTCAAPQGKTRNAAAARLRRLRAGRHPLTGEVLVH